MNSTETDLRAVVLADWLDDGTEADDLTPSAWDETVYDRYMILTDEEADEKVREYIEGSLWAFNASWIVNYLPEGVGEEVVEALQPQCDGANDAIRAMVGERLDELVSDAIATDGRGHFLNTYDGEECEQEYEGTCWYIYRVN